VILRPQPAPPVQKPVPPVVIPQPVLTPKAEPVQPPEPVYKTINPYLPPLPELPAEKKPETLPVVKPVATAVEKPVAIEKPVAVEKPMAVEKPVEAKPADDDDDMLFKHLSLLKHLRDEDEK